MIDTQGRIIDGAGALTPEIGLIRCKKCEWPLAFSLGRSLVLGAVVLRAAVRMECGHCHWGRWWYPAPKEADKNAKARTPSNPGLVEKSTHNMPYATRTMPQTDQSTIEKKNVDKITC